MTRGLTTAILLLVAACARRPGVSAGVEPLFTGAPCDEQRLRADYGTGWREVRGTGFTYCVPPSFVNRGGNSRYWENRFDRFSWGADPRVTDGQLVPFQVANSRVTAPPDERAFTETVDGKAARVVVSPARDGFQITCRFDSPNLQYFARSSSSATNDMLVAVCLSVRITAR